MAGTKAGAMKLRETMIKKYGSEEDWKAHQKAIGAEGGRKTGGKKGSAKPKGFAANPELARISGSKGGRISKRRKKTEE